VKEDLIIEKGNNEKASEELLGFWRAYISREQSDV
jgi:hypothetical protein